MLSVSFTVVATAQNLAPNPGFEDYTVCPSTPNNPRGPICDSWQSGNGSSPDYYNPCSTGCQGAPSNLEGYKTPYDGVAYAGMQALNTFDTWNYEYVEYIMAGIPALQKDTAYVVSINIALAGIQSNYAIAGFGVFFDTYGSPDTTTMENLKVTPQVDYTHYGIVSDTLHWTHLIDTFIADSAYKYMIIGNFKDKYHTDTLRVPGGPNPAWHISYYYIDHVSVQKLSTYQSTAVGSMQVCKPVVVYPNPMTSSTTISFSNDGSGACTLALYNMQGQVVQHLDDIKTTSVTIERRDLPAGCYYYHLFNKTNIIGRGLITIEK